MLADDLVNDYIVWRESARAVTDAYARWSAASGPERESAVCRHDVRVQLRVAVTPQSPS
jgi:hypothetical protein